MLYMLYAVSFSEPATHVKEEEPQEEKKKKRISVRKFNFNACKQS